MANTPIERKTPVAADSPVSGFQTHDPTERGGNTNRTATVSTYGNRAQSCRNRRGRTAGAASRIPAPIIGVAHGTVVQVDTPRIYADFVHVGFADNQSPGLPQPSDYRRIFSGGLVTEKAGADPGRIALYVQFVFDGDGDTIKNAATLIGCKSLSGDLGLRQQLFAIAGDKGTHGFFTRVSLFQRIQKLPGNFQRRRFATPIGLRQVPERAESRRIQN